MLQELPQQAHRLDVVAIRPHPLGLIVLGVADRIAGFAIELALHVAADKLAHLPTHHQTQAQDRDQRQRAVKALARRGGRGRGGRGHAGRSRRRWACLHPVGPQVSGGLAACRQLRGVRCGRPGRGLGGIAFGDRVFGAESLDVVLNDGEEALGEKHSAQGEHHIQGNAPRQIHECDAPNLGPTRREEKRFPHPPTGGDRGAPLRGGGSPAGGLRSPHVRVHYPRMKTLRALLGSLPLVLAAAAFMQVPPQLHGQQFGNSDRGRPQTLPPILSDGRGGDGRLGPSRSVALAYESAFVSLRDRTEKLAKAVGPGEPEISRLLSEIRTNVVFLHERWQQWSEDNPLAWSANPAGDDYLLSLNRDYDLLRKAEKELTKLLKLKKAAAVSRRRDRVLYAYARAGAAAQPFPSAWRPTARRPRTRNRHGRRSWHCSGLSPPTSR